MYLCMYIANNRHEVLDHPSIHPSSTYRVFYGLYAKITTSEWLIARATTKSTRESQYAPPREKSFVTIRFVPMAISTYLSIAVHLLIIKLHLQVLVVVVVNWRCSFLENHLLRTCTLTQFVVNIRHELQDQAGVVSFNPHYQLKGFPPVADVGSVCDCVCAFVCMTTMTHRRRRAVISELILIIIILLLFSYSQLLRFQLLHWLVTELHFFFLFCVSLHWYLAELCTN